MGSPVPTIGFDRNVSRDGDVVFARQHGYVSGERSLFGMSIIMLFLSAGRNG